MKTFTEFRALLIGYYENEVFVDKWLNTLTIAFPQVTPAELWHMQDGDIDIRNYNNQFVAWIQQQIALENDQRSKNTVTTGAVPSNPTNGTGSLSANG